MNTLNEFDKQLDADADAVRKDFAHKHTEMRKVAALFNATLDTARTNSWSSQVALYTAAQAVNLHALELSVEVEKLVFCRDRRTREDVAARVIEIAENAIMDTSQKIVHVVAALKKLGVAEQFGPRLRTGETELENFWAAHEKASAYKIAPAGAVDLIDVIGAGMDLGKIFVGLGSTMQKLLTATSNNLE